MVGGFEQQKATLLQDMNGQATTRALTLGEEPISELEQLEEYLQRKLREAKQAYARLVHFEPDTCSVHLFAISAFVFTLHARNLKRESGKCSYGIRIQKTELATSKLQPRRNLSGARFGVRFGVGGASRGGQWHLCILPLHICRVCPFYVRGFGRAVSFCKTTQENTLAPTHIKK